MPIGYMSQHKPHMTTLGLDLTNRPAAADVDWAQVIANTGPYEASKLKAYWVMREEAKAVGRPVTFIHPATVLGDFADASFTYHDVTSTFTRNGDEFNVRTDGPDGKLQDYKIAYTFGIYPLQQYLIEFPSGRYQALNICWDTRPADQGGQPVHQRHRGVGIGLALQVDLQRQGPGDALSRTREGQRRPELTQ